MPDFTDIFNIIYASVFGALLLVALGSAVFYAYSLKKKVGFFSVLFFIVDTAAFLSTLFLILIYFAVIFKANISKSISDFADSILVLANNSVLEKLADNLLAGGLFFWGAVALCAVSLAAFILFIIKAASKKNNYVSNAKELFYSKSELDSAEPFAQQSSDEEGGKAFAVNTASNVEIGLQSKHGAENIKADAVPGNAQTENLQPDEHPEIYSDIHNEIDSDEVTANIHIDSDSFMGNSEILNENAENIPATAEKENQNDYDKNCKPKFVLPEEKYFANQETAVTKDSVFNDKADPYISVPYAEKDITRQNGDLKSENKETDISEDAYFENAGKTVEIVKTALPPQQTQNKNISAGQRQTPEEVKPRAAFPRAKRIVKSEVSEIFGKYLDSKDEQERTEIESSISKPPIKHK